MAQFKGYGDNIELRSADNLITRRTDDGRVFVIEYEVHGTILANRREVRQSILFNYPRFKTGRIAHWRDYMDSLAAWDALTAQAR